MDSRGNLQGRSCAQKPLAALARHCAAVLCSLLLGSGAGAVTFTPIATGFNNPIGIDHHVPTNQVIMSVHWTNGFPYNFELVAADGMRTQFSTIAGLSDEVKIATIRSGPCQGGFDPGELYVGTGAAGVIARVSADGSTIQNPWVTLPGEGGLMRGSLFHDRYCAFDGDLIAVTSPFGADPGGGVWRIASNGTATKLAAIGVHLEGVTTVPDDPRYGPWAGKILTGSEVNGLIYTVDADGNVASYDLGIKMEDVDIVPDNQNFFGVDFGGGRLLGAPPAEFAGMVGDILIVQEHEDVVGAGAPLYHVRWNAETSAFEKTEIAQGQASHWEHITFSPAGIVDIPPVEPPLQRFAVIGTATASSESVRMRKEAQVRRVPGVGPYPAYPYPVGFSKAGTCGVDARILLHSRLDGSLVLDGDATLSGGFPALSIGQYFASDGGSERLQGALTQPVVGPGACVVGGTVCVYNSDCAAGDTCGGRLNLNDPANTYVDRSGGHQEFQFCAAARGDVDALAAVADSLAPTVVQGDLFTRKGDPPTTYVIDDGFEVIQIDNLRLAKGTEIVIDGEPSTVAILRVSGDFRINTEAKITLTGGITPDRILWVVQGASGTARIGARAVVNGTILVPARTRMRVNVFTEVNGALHGEQVDIRRAVVVNHVPFVFDLNP